MKQLLITWNIMFFSSRDDQIIKASCKLNGLPGHSSLWVASIFGRLPKT